MDQFTSADLQRLTELADAPRVSIYMPTRRAGRDVRENATRFKNLMKAAAERVSRQCSAAKALQARLDEALALQNDDPWWQHQDAGLAMFLDDRRFLRYRLPLEFEELVVVAGRCYVRPLLRLLQGDGRFYLLAASQNRVRLLEGTRRSVDELDVTSLPADLRSALNIDEYLTSLQHHSTSGPAIPGSTIFHGHGAADLDVQKKDEIRQFFLRVCNALEAYFGAERTPLVFAGVDYLFPLFRETCHYRGLVDQPVAGNPDQASAEELHRRAWAIVEPHFAAPQRAALDRFHAGGGSQSATRLPDVLRAARQGAIDTLLLAENQRQWGRLDGRGGFEPADESAAGAEDLLNAAAVDTINSGGTVFSLPPDQLPAGSPAAAILRFPLPPP